MRHRLVPNALAWALVLLASLAPSTGLLAQSVFSPVAAGKEPKVAQRLQLRKNLELRIVDAVLTATADGRATPVPSTEPGGIGACHAMTKEPTGRVVVAADNGLFVLDAGHLITDRMDVEDNLPAGAPLGVAADRKNRIWLCTDADFAVVDTRFGYTRSFAKEELPAGTFRTVITRGDRVLLETSKGWFAYRPDVGKPPSNVGGKLVEKDLEADTSGRATIDLDVRANGGATLRHRRHHHHRLYPVLDNVVDRLRPGKHIVEVLGVDRDLRTGLVARYNVHAPLPPQFSVKLLPLMAAGGCGIVLLLAWPRRGRRRKTRALLRTGVFSVIALQLLAATLGYGRAWPFVGFSMYTENHYEGSVLYKPRLRGIYANGGMQEIGFWAAGIVQDDSWQMLSELAHGDEKRLLHRLNTMNKRRKERGHKGREFVGIEIADTRTRLTADGPFSVAPTVIVRWTKS